MSSRKCIKTSRTLFPAIKSALVSGKPLGLFMGGTRSGKTRHLMIFMFMLALSPRSYLSLDQRRVLDDQNRENLNILIGRQKFIDIKVTLWQDAQWVLRSMDIYPVDGNENDFVKLTAAPERTILFKQSGSMIWFKAAERESSGMGAGFDVVWLNEASEIPDTFYNQVNMRATMFTYFDCNPKMGKNHWIRQKILPGAGRNVFVHHSTFRDNPFLPDRIVKTILSYDPSISENVSNGTADDYMWRVYGLGEFAVKEGLVFVEDIDYDIVEDSQFPSAEVNPSVWSLDFGYKDKMSLNRIVVSGGDIWIREYIYTSGLLLTSPAENPGIDSLVSRFPKMGVLKSDVIVCDCADKEGIEQLRACGYNAIPCRKVEGIVKQISVMKSRRMHFTRSSVGIYGECQEYAWNERDPEGNPIPGCGDHSIDSSRYGINYLISLSNRVLGDFGGLRGGRKRVVMSEKNYFF